MGREVSLTYQQVSSVFQQMGKDPARKKRPCAYEDAASILSTIVDDGVTFYPLHRGS